MPNDYISAAIERALFIRFSKWLGAVLGTVFVFAIPIIAALAYVAVQGAQLWFSKEFDKQIATATQRISDFEKSALDSLVKTSAAAGSAEGQAKAAEGWVQQAVTTNAELGKVARQAQEELRQNTQAFDTIKGVIRNVNDLANEVTANPDFRQKVINLVLPIGAIVAFDVSAGCPDGWSRFETAGGRTLIGAGSHTNLDRSGRPLSRYQVGQSGGEEQHQLTIEEMPAHRHLIPHKGADMAISGNLSTSFGVTQTIGPEYTDNIGGGAAHNTMPPFVAVSYCKKD